jgi:hypothetical protein
LVGADGGAGVVRLAGCRSGVEWSAEEGCLERVWPQLERSVYSDVLGETMRCDISEAKRSDIHITTQRCAVRGLKARTYNSERLLEDLALYMGVYTKHGGSFGRFTFLFIVVVSIRAHT